VLYVAVKDGSHQKGIPMGCHDMAMGLGVAFGPLMRTGTGGNGKRDVGGKVGMGIKRWTGNGWDWERE